MANSITSTKNGKYLKKTGAESYVHYQFDTNDGVVYLSEKIDGANGSGADYAKDVTLHRALSALYTLASKGGQASTDLANHIQNVSNPHSVNKRQVGLGNVVNASMDNTPTAGSNNYVKSGGVYTAVKNVSDKANSAYELASGLSKAYVFGNASAVYHGRVGGTVDSDGATAGTVIDKDFKVGDSVYVKDTLINDFWISAKRKLVTDNTELPISSIDDIKNATDGAEINVKWTIGREYYYVTLTAVETKANLDGYYDKNYINNNYLTKGKIQEDYVPYSGATKPVNLGNNTLTVSDGKTINPTETIIDKGNITLSGSTIIPGMPSVIGQSVVLGLTEINVGGTKFKYPNDDTSGTLATQEFVKGRGYQTETQVNSSIDTTPLTFGGDVIGTGHIGDQAIGLYLTDMADLPTAETTFSAVKVNKKGRVTAGGQQIVFASNLDDPNLNNLVIGGVAIIDA